MQGDLWGKVGVSADALNLRWMIKDDREGAREGKLPFESSLNSRKHKF